MEHLAECGQHSTFVIPNYNSHACCYYCAKTTPSMLILYRGGFGLIHRSMSFTANLGGQKFATWDSLINDLAFWIIILAVCLVFPCRTWFRLNKMLQAKVITSSRISLPTCWTNLRCHNRSINSWKCTPFKSSGISKSVHTSRVFPQCQN